MPSVFSRFYGPTDERYAHALNQVARERNPRQKATFKTPLTRPALKGSRRVAMNTFRIPGTGS